MSIFEKVFGKSDDSLAIDEYNRGLAAKYEGRWKESLFRNQRAQELRPGDEATLWNLAIAATALREWDIARSAWQALGIDALQHEGEVTTEASVACVRLQPEGAAEVVWGTRIDPARIRIENVPFPRSERRFGDIVLNDGAPEGHRLSAGIEYPVFDELGLWQQSAHHTFAVTLNLPNADALEALTELCMQNNMRAEQWSTVRNLCEACSRGNPEAHVCDGSAREEQRIGIAAESEAELIKLLAQWAEMSIGGVVLSVSLELDASTH